MLDQRRESEEEEFELQCGDDKNSVLCNKMWRSGRRSFYRHKIIKKVNNVTDFITAIKMIKQVNCPQSLQNVTNIHTNCISVCLYDLYS